jgi:hypothetical protein
MKLSKEHLVSISAGWMQFKNGHVKEAYISYAKHDERRLNFVMQKNSWYFGQESYSVFIDGLYVCGFTTEALDWIAKVHFPGEYKDEQVRQQ